MQLSEDGIKRLKTYQEAQIKWAAAVDAVEFNAEEAKEARAEYEEAKSSLAIRIDVEYGHLTGVEL